MNNVGVQLVHFAEEAFHMSEHEVLALDSNFEAWKQERASGITVEPFLYYAVEHITKSYTLTDEQVQYGITDDSNDGGIDAVYCLAGKANTLITDEAMTPVSGIDTIRVMVFQVKSSRSDTGFKPDDIDKMAHFADDLLLITDLSGKKLAQKYHSHLVSIINAFKKTYLSAAGNFPSLHLEFYYVTRGDEDTLNAAGKAAMKRLIEIVHKHRGTDNSNDSVNLYPIDSCALLTYVRKRRQKTRQLTWDSQPIPIGKGYLGIVKLQDYFNFLKDESGALDELIFESNVRGNQGKTSVNRQMRAALDDGGTPDFWQLNNGVTITCASISPIDAFNLSLEDAQVVNGLQTSRQIFGHFSEHKPTSNETRTVIVKLIPVADDAVRDKIIRATNNQNPIKSSTLVLTGEVHRDIEDLFKAQGFFYDRRPGFYKDQGKEITKIISLNEVAQAAIAVLLHRPDDARGRPGSYIGGDGKTGEKHKLLFRPRQKAKLVELRSYLKAVLIVRKVAEFINSVSEIDLGERHNILFHVSYHVVCSIIGYAAPTIDEVYDITSSQLTQEKLQSSYKTVLDAYRKQVKDEDNPDIVAKGSDFLAALKKTLPTAPSTASVPKVTSVARKKIKDILSEAEFKW
jgi:hypothetical protein